MDCSPWHLKELDMTEGLKHHHQKTVTSLNSEYLHYFLFKTLFPVPI